MDECPKKGRVPKPAKTQRQRYFVSNLRWAIERLGLTQRALAQKAGVREDWLRRASSQGVKWTKTSGTDAVAALAEYLGCPVNTLWDQDGHTFRQAVSQKHLRGRDVVTEFETVYRHFETDPPLLLTTAMGIIAYLRRSIDDPSAEPPDLLSLAECSGNGATQAVEPSPSPEPAEPLSPGSDEPPGPIATDQAREQSNEVSPPPPAIPSAVVRSPKPNHVLIKWTGSKQRQAKQIVSHFPSTIETYFEPFLGGGSVLFELLGCDIAVRRFECSDICEPLIKLWNLVRFNPKGLVERYAENWQMLQARGIAHFKHVRREFNTDRSPYHLFFLTRACRAGHVRFNRAGAFNAICHEANPGMSPEAVEPLINEWQRRLAGRDITFVTRSYSQIPPKVGDLVYLDPPYETGRGRYYDGPFDHARLFDWLRAQPCGYLLSLNGFLGDEDRTLDVPEDIYDEHLLIERGECPHDRLAKREPRQVSESLYVRRGKDEGQEKTRSSL